MAKKSKTALLALPVGMVERRIHIVRKQRVMLDSDLAELYEVATKRSIKRSGATSIASPPTS